jgi:hypothetical protein
LVVETGLGLGVLVKAWMSIQWGEDMFSMAWIPSQAWRKEGEINDLADTEPWLDEGLEHVEPGMSMFSLSLTVFPDGWDWRKTLGSGRVVATREGSTQEETLQTLRWIYARIIPEIQKQIEESHDQTGPSAGQPSEVR